MQRYNNVRVNSQWYRRAINDSPASPFSVRHVHLRMVDMQAPWHVLFYVQQSLRSKGVFTSLSWPHAGMIYVQF